MRWHILESQKEIRDFKKMSEKANLKFLKTLKTSLRRMNKQDLIRKQVGRGTIFFEKENLTNLLLPKLSLKEYPFSLCQFEF